MKRSVRRLAIESFAAPLLAATVACSPPPSQVTSDPPEESQLVEPVAVGWSEVVWPHESGEGAIDVAAALDAQPSRTDLRIELALALAREGRTDPAWEHLTRALTEDLPRTRPIALEHADLAQLRADHPELPEVLDTLERHYQRAFERGVPAFVFQPRSPWAERPGHDPQVPYSGLRVGVYDSSNDQFVPMLPPIEGALAAAFDRQSRRALLVSGALVTSMWNVTLGELEAHVFELSTPSAAVLTTTDLVTSEMSESVSVHLDPNAPVVWVVRDELGGITYYDRVDEDGSREAGLEAFNGTTEDTPVDPDFHRGSPFIHFALLNGPDDDNTVYAAHRWPETKVPAAVKDQFENVVASHTASDGTVVVETSDALFRCRPPRSVPEQAMAGVHLSLPDLPVGEGGV